MPTTFDSRDVTARKSARRNRRRLTLSVGVLMIADVLTWLQVPLALFIGSVGTVSAAAVYIDRRELKCACVDGSSNVPPGFVSLTQNMMMVAMALWMATGR